MAEGTGGHTLIWHVAAETAPRLSRWGMRWWDAAPDDDAMDWVREPGWSDAGARNRAQQHTGDVSAQHQQMLELQNKAGNAAFIEPVGNGPRVVGNATKTLESWLASSRPDDQYAVQVKAMTDDAIGHAWITVAPTTDPSRKLAIGFYPASWSGGLVGAGELLAPDGHDGEESFLESAVIDQVHFRRLLEVVRSYQDHLYSLLFSNCADFARRAWNAGTERIIDFEELETPALIWNPAMIGMEIEQANRAQGLDRLGRPLTEK